MNKTMLFPAACFFILGVSNVLAGAEPETVVEEKIVIALETDDFAIEETDLSHLAVGDAETIITESGKTVDMLRTEDGVEIYVDGELLDTGGMHDGHHTVHRIEIICDGDEDDCADLEAMAAIEDIEIDKIHSDGHEVIIVRGDGDDADIDIEALTNGPHEVHGTVHIVKEFENVDIDELDENHNREVIIIRKKVEDEI